MAELLSARMLAVSAKIDERLACALSRAGMQPLLAQSMRYTALAGGKRIRPFLTAAVAEMFTGDKSREEAALLLGTALEMIHSYSLIHDDLPCMDNDAMRRGKPSNHIVYGEAGAVLAGDGLLTEAFYLAACAPLPPEETVRAVKTLADAAGAAGMVGGQVLDLQNERKEISREELDGINALKTGALISCAGALGCIAAGLSPDSEQAKRIANYSACVGRCFQLVDDLLDATGDAASLGKNVGIDRQNEKKTYVTLLGVDGCRKEAARLTKAALDAVAPFENAVLLRELAVYLSERTV